MSRFSRKAPANTVSPAFDPFDQPKAKVEILEYEAQSSGNTFAAVSVNEMLAICGIKAPEGVMFPATAEGKEQLMLIKNPRKAPAPKPSQAEKPNPAVVGTPLATFHPDKLLAAILSRMSQDQLAALTGQPAVTSQAPAKRKARSAA